MNLNLVKQLQSLKEEDLFPNLSKKEVKGRATQREQERKRRRQEILSGASKMTVPEALEVFSVQPVNIDVVPEGAKYAIVDLDNPNSIDFYTEEDFIARATRMLGMSEE
jgi:formylmethanofuran dehydrogenase subunit E